MSADPPPTAPYDPEWFRLLHTGNPGDVEFYLARCAPDHTVLELGCGTGRISLALVAAGARVTAMDTHPGMLAFLRERAAELDPASAARLSVVAGDMADFDLPGRFDRIIIPFNGLFCLLSDEAVAACLARVRAHLAPEGLLILDAYRVFTPDPDYEPEDDPEPLTTLTDGRVVVEIFERADWDQPGQRLDAYYLHRILEDGQLREEEYCIPQRYLFLEQLQAQLARAGLTVREWSGDFDGAPFDEEADHMVVVAGLAGRDGAGA